MALEAVVCQVRLFMDLMDLSHLTLAIGFYPYTTKLFIRVATTLNTSLVFESFGNLPLNAKTNVRFEAVGRELMLFLNNTFERYELISADRISGNANVYVSDPWNQPAVANL